MREYHVRICEGLGVKFPGSTRHSRPGPPVSRSSHVRFTPESCRGNHRLGVVSALGPIGDIVGLRDRMSADDPPAVVGNTNAVIDTQATLAVPNAKWFC